jgi:hypothetical protein
MTLGEFPPICLAADWLADDPVYLEPVSGPNSLITGKNTGNFGKLTYLRLRNSRIVPMQSGLLIQFPTYLNREFLKREQGSKSSQQGIWTALPCYRVVSFRRLKRT